MTPERAALQAAFEDACEEQADMAERHMRESNDMAQRVWDAAMAVTQFDAAAVRGLGDTP